MSTLQASSDSTLVLFSWLVLMLGGCGTLGAFVHGRQEENALASALVGIPAGIATMMCVGSWLGLVGWYRPGILTAVAVLALLAGCITHFKKGGRFLPTVTRPASPWLAGALLMLAVSVVFIVRYVGRMMLNSDDTTAYLPFAQLFSMSGGFTPHPFSERRLFALASELPLRAEAVALFGIRGALSIDLWFGLFGSMIYLGGLAMVRTRSARFVFAMTLACATLLRTLMILVTIAPQYLQILFFVPLLALFFRDEPKDVTRAELVVAGLLAAALLGLRTSLVPLLAMLALVAITRAVQANPQRTLPAACVVGASVFAALLPLMIASFASGNTFLFPYTGRGIHASAVGLGTLAGEATTLQLRLASAFEAIPRNPAFGLAVAILWLRSSNSWRAFARRSAAVAVVAVCFLVACKLSGGTLVGEERYRMPGGQSFGGAAAAITNLIGFSIFVCLVRLAKDTRMLVAAFAAWLVILAFATGGTSLFRYAVPALLSLTIAVAVHRNGLADDGSALWYRAITPLVLLVPCAVFFFASDNRCCSSEADPAWGDVRRVLRDSLPAGSRILSSVDRNDLLVREFGDRVVLNDQPGLAGPELGLRAERGDVELACLTELGIGAVVSQEGSPADDSLLTTPSAIGSWVDSQASQFRTLVALRRNAAQAARVWRVGQVVILPLWPVGAPCPR